MTTPPNVNDSKPKGANRTTKVAQKLKVLPEQPVDLVGQSTILSPGAKSKEDELVSGPPRVGSGSGSGDQSDEGDDEADNVEGGEGEGEDGVEVSSCATD